MTAALPYRLIKHKYKINENVDALRNILSGTNTSSAPVTISANDKVNILLCVSALTGKLKIIIQVLLFRTTKKEGTFKFKNQYLLNDALLKEMEKFILIKTTEIFITIMWELTAEVIPMVIGTIHNQIPVLIILQSQWRGTCVVSRLPRNI